MKPTFVVRSFRVFVAVLLAAAVVLMSAAVASSDDGGDVALEKSIVFLQTKWSGFVQVPPGDDAAGQGFWTKELSYSVMCTGWYASKQAHIVTAGHCVDPNQGREVILNGYLKEQNATDLADKAMANWQVEGETKGSPVGRSVRAIQPNGVDGATITSATTVEVVDFKPTDNGDVALLHVPNMTKETPGMVIAQNSPKVGDAVTSIGFPGDLQDVADQSQIAHASFKAGTVSSQQVTPQGVTTLEISAPLAPGMSGGPTVNKDEQVVGVNSAGLTTEANFNFITNTTDLRSFLISHNVPLIAPPAPPGGMAGVVWFVIAGIGLAAVLLVVIVGVVLVRRRRSPQSPQFATAGGPPFPGYPGQIPAPMSSQPPGYPGTGNPMPETGATAASAWTQTPPAAPIASWPTPGSSATAETPSGAAPTISSSSADASSLCRDCGAGHGANARFCPNCGRPLS